MKKTRILTRIVATICIILILFGCKKEPIYRIGVSQCSSDDWRTKMNEEVMMEAMLHDDLEVEIRSADDNNEKQIADIDYFVNNGFDAIIISPNEAEALTPAVRDAYNKGIPVIIFDRNINDTTYTQRIGVDNTELGRSAGRYAAQLTTDSLKVLEIYGLRGSTPAEERSRGFKATIETLNGKIIASGAADWKKEMAERVADSLLKLYPETNVIFAHNDRMAIGASEVVRQKGLQTIKVIGIDAAPSIGLKAVADGVIDATFIYPTEGMRVLEEALKIVKGEPYEKEVILPLSSAVDSTNADILLMQNAVIEEDSQKVKTMKGMLDDYLSRHTAQTFLLVAIIVIAVLLFGILFLVLRTFWQHRRHQSVLLQKNKLLEEERDKQKELNQKLEEATQSKLVFFTNVSHDLRTPLTLISEPVSQLNKADNLTESQKTLIRIADKNVRILQRLINEILDFRKFENDKLTLNLTEVDFRKVISDWMESFYAVAGKRDIKLLLQAPEGNEAQAIAIDVEKIERVFFNLISNALKYSPDNSKITVDYRIKDESLILRVADTGEGISEENIRHIFDRFFQVDHIRPKGSGIGLSLAKAFVELHGGTINVTSELKKGTIFTVILPVRHVDSYTTQVDKTISEEEVKAELEEVESETNFEKDKPLVLVIDDNKDIREMMTELLKGEYNVVTASNGKDGIKKASKYVPDIIVCDVMMPGIDGMETCSLLKTETATSHIPVLLLTACSLDEQRVEGYDSGADGYLAKPFSSAVLKAQISSFIANRKRIKDLFGTDPIVNSTGEGQRKSLAVTASGIDNDFYNKFLEIFNREIGNPDINVENIAAAMGLERTQFYRKIKAITNYSPVELMRNIRLKRSRQLLTGTDKTISEICYEVGFSTPAYFTKCYKEAYSETPSETRSNLN